MCSSDLEVTANVILSSFVASSAGFEKLQLDSAYTISGDATDNVIDFTGATQVANGAQLVINGLAGNDTLGGGDQGDVLNGGTGDDYLKGNAGDDILDGNSGTNKLFGGDDNDQLVGENGHDTMFGQDGDDIIYADQGLHKLGTIGTGGVYTVMVALVTTSSRSLAI